MKVIDLFCGAGGFSLGFEMAGFETLFAMDIWDKAIKTFNYNRSENIAIKCDIEKYTNKEVDKMLNNTDDFVGIIGGPPCQGFSMVGTRDKEDNRNSLYLEYVRIVERANPMFIVLENVKGLLSLEKGYFKQDIIERFERIGYNISYDILKASEYGIPQNRERVFFVGLRKDIFKEIYFTFPKSNKIEFVSTKEALSDLPKISIGEKETEYMKKPSNEFQKFMRGTNKIITNNEITNHTDKTKNIISQVPDGGSIKDVSKELYKVRNYNAAFKRMNSKLPSSTIDCGHRNYFHYNENRIPTARESARIQSFKDNYHFLGSKSDQYKQIGNAVPPLLAYKIAKEIKILLDNI